MENLNLSMSGNMLGNKSLIQIEKILKTYSKQLKNISFNNNEINDNKSKYLGKGLSYLSGIESLSLNLDECTFDSEGIQNITYQLPKSIQKFSFSFNYNMIGDENMQTFCDNMKFDPKKLIELDSSFAQNEFNNDGVIYLSKKISKFSELRILSINFRQNSISDEGLSALFENLSKLPKIQKLQLKKSGLYEDIELEKKELFLREAHNSKQLTINLKDNNIKRKGIQMLAQGIKQNKTISDLSLNFFYGKLENLDHLLITIIDEILNNQRSFGELNIISNNYSEEREKKFYDLLNLICLTNFEQIIKIIQLKKNTSTLKQIFIRFD
ncbi:hypothetical protein ABPG72_007612 [Tetrahymena utriculariae]